VGQQNVALAACAAIFLSACERPQTAEAALREALTKQSMGIIRLPSGDIVISEPLRLLKGAMEMEIRGADNTRLIASKDFKGAAMFVVEKATNVTFGTLSSTAIGALWPSLLKWLPRKMLSASGTPITESSPTKLPACVSNTSSFKM